MSPCNFKFGCEQRVNIVAISASGVVDERKDCRGVHEYLIVYWLDGQRRCEWMSEWEITA